MILKLQVLDELLEPMFQVQTEINALHLVVVAESREATARDRGEAWTVGAITFFAKTLIDLMNAGVSGEAVERAAVDLAMAAWLHDSIYRGVDEDLFLRCELEFTLQQDGTVEYERRRPIG